jgi:hypothetical protein
MVNARENDKVKIFDSDNYVQGGDLMMGIAASGSDYIAKFLKLNSNGELTVSTTSGGAGATDPVAADGYSTTVTKVLIVNTSGVPIKISQLEENRSGSDCSGTDGAVGRVLTLQNTSETGAPVSVWVDGTLISLPDMTIVHKTALSTIEFAVNIYNAQEIKVLYYV